ncbi:unnamed protein product [Rotaria magnacalcarata]|nr:unnamed protein product [Rotaria magnacalcarata]
MLTSNTFIIVDDEKYFTFSNDDMPQNIGFYAFGKEDAPDNVKFKTKEKYPKKVLGWLALSAKGISTPYIGSTKGPAITADIYVNKCLRKLRSFIEEYHAGDEYIFWPDLASSHYANKTTRWFHEQNIKFVPKQDNPPNVPQARPIEDFWSILAGKNLYYITEQSSNSAMLNIPEPVPPPESVPSIPELGQIRTLSDSGIGSSDSGIGSSDSGISSCDSGIPSSDSRISSSDSRNSTEFSPIPELDESGVTGNS